VTNIRRASENIGPLSEGASFWQLSPFLVFVATFLYLIVRYPALESARIDDFPLFACLLATIWAFFTFRGRVSFNEKVEIFVSGAAQPTIIYMCFIFIFSSIFAHFLTLTGGVDAMVGLGISVIPTTMLLPGIFAVVSLFSFVIGSSIGTITTFMPIAMGFMHSLCLDPTLLSGVVVCGAMLGDNLSVISDTTIAATQTLGCAPHDKLRENIKLAVPAFLATAIILYWLGTGIDHCALWHDPAALSLANVIKIVPYGVVLALALAGVDVLAVLVVGTMTAALLGVAGGAFSPIFAITSIFDGFYASKKMVAVFVLVMMIAGLSKLIEANGGIDYLLRKFRERINTTFGAECSMSFLVLLVNAVIAKNTISILTVGPIAQKVSDQFKVGRPRMASLLDIFACACQGIIPYSPQLLLAGALAQVSSFSVMPYLYYQFFILIAATCSIVWRHVAANRCAA